MRVAAIRFACAYPLTATIWDRRACVATVTRRWFYPVGADERRQRRGISVLWGSEEVSGNRGLWRFGRKALQATPVATSQISRDTQWDFHR